MSAKELQKTMYMFITFAAKRLHATITDIVLFFVHRKAKWDYNEWFTGVGNMKSKIFSLQ